MQRPPRSKRVNPLPLARNLTFAVGLARGATNDAFAVWQFTNYPGRYCDGSHLAYEAITPLAIFKRRSRIRALLFYVAGQSNVSSRS